MQILPIVFTLLAPPAAPAADWPQWRGPHRDGRLEGFPLPAKFPTALKEDWRVEVGEGHASPIFLGGRIFVFARQGDEEVVLCLDPSGGREIWRSSYPAPYEPNSAARAHGKGPKSTPAAAGRRIFTLGISGILSSLELETGALKWRKEFTKEFPRTSPLYGTAASPLIEGELVIAQVGGHDGGALTAFEAETGKPRWSFAGDGPGYSSPVVLDLAGARQIVTQTQTRLVGVSLSEGKLLWEIPFKTPYDQNVVTPVLYRDLLVYSGLEQGLAAIRLEKEGAKLVPREVWRNKDLSSYMSSPVVEGDLLFGHSHRRKGELFCLDAATGKVHWKSDGSQGDNAALISSGSVLIALTTDARLEFIAARKERFEKLAGYKAAPSQTWAHPLLLPGRALVKDKTSLISLSFKDGS
jgi:outer membrane protein assembly factor BamB